MRRTTADRKAIREKLENHRKVVLCPRCGKPLKYISFGINHKVIRCSTIDCIHAVFEYGRELSKKELQKKADEYWEEKAHEPLEAHPIPPELMERLRKAGWIK